LSIEAKKKERKLSMVGHTSEIPALRRLRQGYLVTLSPKKKKNIRYPR
jgi:hypothetical protein